MSTELDFQEIGEMARFRRKIRNNVLNTICPICYTKNGHVRRKNEEKLPQTFLEMCPPGRRRKGRPRISWVWEITGMREKGINMEWIDREEWKR